jgi:heme-degrading monooxygenase HmoA
MTYMLVRHKVADFSAWKLIFDSHSAAQQQSGLRAPKILRNLDDPNEVVLLFEVTDLEKARAFVSSPEVPAAKEQSGVVDRPDIYFLS